MRKTSMWVEAVGAPVRMPGAVRLLIERQPRAEGAPEPEEADAYLDKSLIYKGSPRQVPNDRHYRMRIVKGELREVAAPIVGDEFVVKPPAPAPAPAPAPPAPVFDTTTTDE